MLFILKKQYQPNIRNDQYLSCMVFRDYRNENSLDLIIFL